MSAIDREPFPKGALIAVGAMLCFSVAATAFARYERLYGPQPPVTNARPWTFVDLNFVDGTDGSVLVRESGTGKLVMALPPGGDGFVRGVMRGLARDRLSRGVGPTPPFRLAEWEKGHLTLQDSATGRVIDLDAFGPSNRESFARFLRKGQETS